MENNKPKSLSEAIAKLEQVGSRASNEIKEDVYREISNVKDALKDIAPFIEQFKTEKVDEAKNEAEASVRKNPWLVIGAVAVLAFFVGWIFSKNKKHE